MNENPEKRSTLPRRKLLQGGAGLAPVLMTLHGRPVLADQTCPTTSAFASMSPSGGPGGEAIVTHGDPCGGRSPAYWAQAESTSNWPRGYKRSNNTRPLADAKTTVNQCFDPGMPEDMSLLSALKGYNGSEAQAVTAYLVAALLNAEKGLNTSALGASQVKAIWRSYRTLGYWMPVNDVQFFASRTLVRKDGGSSLSATASGGQEYTGGILGWLKRNVA